MSKSKKTNCTICNCTLIEGVNWNPGNRNGRCHDCRMKSQYNRISSMPDPKALYQRIKYSERVRSGKKQFTITIQDIEKVDTDICPYLEIPIKRYNYHDPDKKQKRPDDSKTLDRIDSSKGYIPGNIIVCSWKANRMKCDSTITELGQLYNNLYKITNSHLLHGIIN